MRRLSAIVIMAAALAGCATANVVPDFAAEPYVPFNREDAVAIALREWRLFGSLSDLPDSPEPAVAKPERAPGLWERVGEYWWLGLGGQGREARWTGKHDENGRVFPALADERYAWSAAFISYVMRIAGAGDRFPYAANHAAYVNAAASGRSSILTAHAPQSYTPKLGDLLCSGREWASGLRFSDLPTSGYWPGHCAIVVARQDNMLIVVGGNDVDAVTMEHVTMASDGGLSSLNQRIGWPIAIELRYDSDSEPGPR